MQPRKKRQRGVDREGECVMANVGDVRKFGERDDDDPLAERVDDNSGQIPEKIDSQRRIVLC